MPSIYDLKPAFQNLLRPIASGIARAGGTANQVTVAAVLGSIGVGGAIYLYPTASSSWPLLLVGPWLFLRMALNAIDGMLAREHGQKSLLGGVLNELGDVISDAALYLPFAFVPGWNPSLVVLIVLLAALTEMTGVVCVQIGASRRYDGPFGKSDRAFVFGVMGLVVGLTGSAGLWINWALATMAVLSAMTVINRARRGLAERHRP
ncbi:MAG TPA: CDP-alcohol phosphatidyltransferase family protein [Vicinamibacterales bacterium]|nr:CDP-alcohol phosphatidyltransferase family protein [Vicinamibacterales bacterium]